MNNQSISIIKRELEDQLLNSVIPFWENNSVDLNNGGNFNCLDRNGEVYDTTKHMWLQGRLVWMFSKMYNKYDKRDNWLSIAKNGMDFMFRNAIRNDNRVYFSLAENGQPVYMQRKIFSECFYTIALAEYGRAINSESHSIEAKEMLDFIWEISVNPQKVGRPIYEGESTFKSLAIPMIILNVIDEVYQDNYHAVIEKVNYCIDEIKKHFVNEIMFENILADGSPDNSSAGRLVNPGHAIEAGWFLFQWAKKISDNDLKNFSIRIIKKSIKFGWDNEYGGLYYFLDANGYSPVQLEWNMKLWWPHCEALYASLLIYSETNDEKDLEQFLKIKDYTLSKFPDKLHGEWFGYLSREGEITHRFKGGPYKGCFHIPRALLLSINLLDELDYL